MKNGSFCSAKKYIARQGTKALYSLLKKMKRLQLPIDMQFDLFNKTVKPVLLYGCEVWGFGNLDIIERVHLKFLKYILNVRVSTPNCIIYGETGTMPISIDIHIRHLTYWAKLIVSGPTLACNMYSVMRTLYTDCRPNTAKRYFGWIESVRKILIDCGHIAIWHTHIFPNTKWLKLAVSRKL